MTIEPVALKSGVLFVRTPSGGTLMDISADRYIALTPLSAMIWSGPLENQAAYDLGISSALTHPSFGRTCMA